MKSLKFFGAALCVLASSAVFADDSVVQIHGFGGWSYGKSDLSYMTATKNGNAKTAEFALNVSARPYDRLSIIAQVHHDSFTEKTELDYGFAEWQATDQLKLRVGRVKHPFGLYGEVYNVGTVRPFQILPQSVYGPIGFTAKAYNGAGLTGTKRAGQWELLYDLYAGQIDGNYSIAMQANANSDRTASPWRELGFTYSDVIGGRLHVTTPIDGLMVGTSAFRGSESLNSATGSRKISRYVYLGSAEFARGPVTLRAEYVRGKTKNSHGEKGHYIEGSYRITPKWEAAARWEDHELSFPTSPGAGGPVTSASIRQHEDKALGLNYWFNANFVLRANYHMVEGNRFAYAATNGEMLDQIASGGLDTDTNALIIGAQFSF